MCGILGYIGHRNAQDILLNGLRKLEYRGYDSTGIAVVTDQGMQVEKAQGRLAVLEGRLRSRPLHGRIGIGHTRWATHGGPSEVNAHPHKDREGKISVVHNGIIENYLPLKEELQSKGYSFVSETDTEVIAHLLADLYDGDIVSTVRRAVKRMRGAYALAVLCSEEPDKLIAVRLASPLIIGIGQGENFIGSDIPAILEYTRDVYILNDGEMAVLTNDGVDLMTIEGNLITREMVYVDWDVQTAEKAGYDHFMLKEIHEQPKAYRDTMGARIDESDSRVILDEVRLTAEQLRGIQHIQIVACGTAYHAGLVGRQVMEQMVRVPTTVEVASEYRYRNPIINEHTLVIVVSQSGETADTLAALREAKRQGARVIAITNVVGSSAAREADDCIITWAGPEIAVASTKAYTTQLIVFYLLGMHFAQLMGTMDRSSIVEILKHMRQLPEQVQALLDQSERVRATAERLAEHEHLFYIGRGLDYAAAQEGSLKLKEISYIHSEAYAAGEMKHGTLALIEQGTPVIALATQTEVMEKTISNIIEVRARGAYVIGITAQGNEELEKSVDEVFYIPRTLDLLTPALAIVPLQLLAYYAALARGNDVDKPRNLAKSVTVE